MSREFSEFAAEYEFRHVTASPYHPQGNGEAERAVGTVKSLLKKGDDPYKALLAYRSTPLQLGYSPAELLMGRVPRTTVPTTIAQRKPKIPNLTSVREKDKKSKVRQKQDFDSHHGARELPLLQPGDQVWVSGREMEAEVQGEVAPQSYVVETEDGTFRRNRQQLVRLPNSETENTSGSHDRAEMTNRSKNRHRTNRANRSYHHSSEGVLDTPDRPNGWILVGRTEHCETHHVYVSLVLPCMLLHVSEREVWYWHMYIIIICTVCQCACAESSI